MRAQFGARYHFAVISRTKSELSAGASHVKRGFAGLDFVLHSFFHRSYRLRK